MKQRILFEHQNNDDHDVAEIADSSIMNLAYLSRSKRSVPSPQLPPPPMMMLPPLPPPPPHDYDTTTSKHHFVYVCVSVITQFTYM